ncbi:MAG: hypothetical protein KAH67_01070 [Flavobacteriaceae bacterium]|nr:hypothetical protein [Flavobacteriaceae bacterium]
MKSKIRHIIFIVGAFMIPFFVCAQEDVASTEDMLIEQQNINFQTFFFESLKQKAIGNYDKAVYALETCNNIDSENVAVLYELSKNYVFLLKYSEAEYYILKGLEIEPSNLYMLKHLKEIKSNQNDYVGAINIQKKIIKIDSDEESELVILYIKSGEIENAIALLKKLDIKNKLPSDLKALKKSLIREEPKQEFQNSIVTEPIPKNKLDNLKEDYKLKNDFNSLKLVLERELKTKQYLDLLKDSENAINLYPAQPIVYLMNGVALNNLRKYNEGIKILETGLEYLVDDNKLESQFMEQLSLSYKGLGENKKATSYYKKAIELRNK